MRMFPFISWLVWLPILRPIFIDSNLTKYDTDSYSLDYPFLEEITVHLHKLHYSRLINVLCNSKVRLSLKSQRMRTFTLSCIQLQWTLIISVFKTKQSLTAVSRRACMCDLLKCLFHKHHVTRKTLNAKQLPWIQDILTSQVLIYGIGWLPW